MVDGTIGSLSALLGSDRLSGLSVASTLVLAIRLSRGWTQARLARRLGVSSRTISRWETGAAEPNTRDLMIFRAMLRATKSPGTGVPGLLSGNG